MWYGDAYAQELGLLPKESTDTTGRLEPATLGKEQVFLSEATWYKI